jgi:hypothetical protein
MTAFADIQLQWVQNGVLFVLILTPETPAPNDKNPGYMTTYRQLF